MKKEPIKSPYQNLIKPSLSQKELEKISEMLGVEKIIVIAGAGTSGENILNNVNICGLGFKPSEVKIILRAVSDDMEGIEDSEVE